MYNGEEKVKLEVGMVFNLVEELFEYYKMYGNEIGFQIIKRSSTKNDDGELKFVSYSCARCGISKSNSMNACKLQPTTKTGCKARLGASICPDGKWRITSITFEHNHELHTPGKVQYFKSNRVLKSFMKRKLELNDRAGIRLNKKINSFVVEAGGHDNLPFLEKDCRNYIDKIRRLRLGEGDVTAIQNYFLKMQVHLNEVNCNCRLCESKGILCRHAIAVLIRHGIFYVPDKYILSCWRKDVKRCHTNVKISYDNWDVKPEGQRFDKMCNSFYEVADLATNNEETFCMVMKAIDCLKAKLTIDGSGCGSSQCCANLIKDAIENEDLNNTSNEKRNILTPRVVRSKGRPPYKRRQSKVKQIIQKKKGKQRQRILRHTSSAGRFS
ncbi:hypothetical protein Ddye_014240 [Dipteronia dyeriana]|uniref:SWIM-type domain-containing protein n=1 Tax=Dipteronia dyeriana TaxID=168575 RepID=A0AAE0CKE6_9ROSI|nr:hypothetical protein Ddye_014240 [Dipteronia dyeriana]